MSLRAKQLMYAVMFVVCMIIIFFVGVSTNKTTGATEFSLTSDIATALKGFKKGMDVAGGVKLTYKIDLAKYKEAYPNPTEYIKVTKSIKEIILKNIDNRISKLWVSDYSSYVQTLKDGEYLIIEIGGVADLDEAKKIIGKTVELEFKIPYDGSDTSVIAWRQLVAEELLKQAVKNSTGLAQLGDKKTWEGIFYFNNKDISADQLPELYKNRPELLKRENGVVSSQLLSGTYAAGLRSNFGKPEDMVLNGWTISRYNGSREGTWYNASGTEIQTTLYSFEDIVVEFTPPRVGAKDPKTNSLLNGAYFKMAGVSQSQLGQPVVTIQFDDTGKEIFCNLTETIVGKPMAIFIGGQLVTSPSIREKICGGSAQIDGSFTAETARKLTDELNQGALPAPLTLAQEEKLSPVLGEQVLSGALITGLVGIIAIFVYFYIMYGFRQSFTALITLVMYVAITFAFVKLVGYALSMSGFASLILSIGMAVDANILLYERLREELQEKISIPVAIGLASERSSSAIWDGNMTTMFIAILLWALGVNIFKGYGSMMVINQLVTIFLVVPLTKDLLYTFYGTKAE
jgi:protein-export membrane protein SecD